jgi:hypothetical protein
LLQQQFNLNNLIGAANAAVGTSPNLLSQLDPNVLSLLNGSGLNLNQLLSGKNMSNAKANKTNRGLNPQAQKQQRGFADEESVVAAAMMAAAAANAMKAKPANNRMKGSSMSPGTTCSDETETGSPKSEPIGQNGNCSSSISSLSSSGSAASSRRRPPIKVEEESAPHLSHHRHDDDDNDDLNENDCDDVDEDSRSLPHSHSPHNGDNDAMNANGESYGDSSLMMDDENGDHLNECNESYDEDSINTTTNSQQNDQGRRSRSKKSSPQKKNSHNSTSSPARSSSSPCESRSVSPSNTFSGDSHSAAFPNLAGFAGANGLDSATAMLAAQSLLQQNTPGLPFSNMAGLATTPNGSGDLFNSLLSSDAAVTAANGRNRIEMCQHQIV